MRSWHLICGAAVPIALKELILLVLMNFQREYRAQANLQNQIVL